MVGNKDKQVVVITGGATGIGYGVAQEFAKTGSNVAIFDMDLEQAKKAAETLKQDFGIEARAYLANVTNEEQVNKAVDDAAKDFGHLDVLLNNAGIQIISEFAEFKLDDWKKIMDVHVNGCFLVAKAVMRQMIKQGNGGKLIFIGSIHSVVPALNKSAYIAAKHAKVGMVRAIAKEGAPHNIAANLVGPGYVRTHLINKQIPEQAKLLKITEEEVVKNILLPHTLDGKFTTPEEVARAVLFFANFPGLGVTGQSMYVSHGWLM